jgi:hypothetical protein
MLLCVQTRQTAIGSRERMHTTLHSIHCITLCLGFKSYEVRRKYRSLDPPDIQISLQGTDGWAIHMQRRKGIRMVLVFRGFGICSSPCMASAVSCSNLKSESGWIAGAPSQTCSSRPLEWPPTSGMVENETKAGSRRKTPEFIRIQYGVVCVSWWKLEGGGCRDVTVYKHVWQCTVVHHSAWVYMNQPSPELGS